MKVERLKMKAFNLHICLALLLGAMVAVPVFGAADQDQLMRDLQNMSSLQMRSTSYMMSNRHLHVTPTAVQSPNVPKAQGDVFTYFGSKDMKGTKRVWVADQLFLNGANLMTTGSRYSSNTELNSNVTTTTHIGRPRKVNVNDPPEEPFEDDPVPVGDALWPLLACMCAYIIVLRVRKRKRLSVES